MPAIDPKFDQEMAGLSDLQAKVNSKHGAAMPEARTRLAPLSQQHGGAIADARRRLDTLDHRGGMADSHATLDEHVNAYEKAIDESRAKLRELERQGNTSEAYTRKHQREMEEAKVKIDRMSHAKAMAEVEGRVDDADYKTAMREADGKIAMLGHEAAMAEAREKMRTLSKS
ncbi:hypothetical protein GGR52DRAFT_434797 [Hypoxylon sp. FL1284]|nr:hypothetical protein GGR52DRAFT_434797 [Hypoxylon sp. FL1284]